MIGTTEEMTDIGIYAGNQGLDTLLTETNSTLARKDKVVIALAGLPGCGKTFIVKNFIRFGFGNFPRNTVKVIDDNNIYTTKLWKLHWEKIKLDKGIWQDFVNDQDFKVLFFSNWIPSRFIDFADIVVNVKVDEHERIARLKKRYPTRPDKFLIQQAKTKTPVEMPFTYDVMMTYTDPKNETRRWAIIWLMKRLYYRPAGKTDFSLK
jgi:predicted ATPase